MSFSNAFFKKTKQNNNNKKNTNNKNYNKKLAMKLYGTIYLTGFVPESVYPCINLKVLDGNQGLHDVLGSHVFWPQELLYLEYDTNILINFR